MGTGPARGALLPVLKKNLLADTKDMLPAFKKPVITISRAHKPLADHGSRRFTMAMMQTYVESETGQYLNQVTYFEEAWVQEAVAP